ncbi:MAG: hypothetical protein GWP19_10570 [Planctomycetia bacterium]|nr:hypothetical protein [Planctomycetia bacterium]
MPISSLSKNLSVIEESYAYYLIKSADVLMTLIKEVLEKDYDKLELVYFVEYVVCDVFKTSSFTEQTYSKVVNEFLKNHLFREVSLRFETKSGNLVNDLNNYSDQVKSRMNEYKISYSISDWFIYEHVEKQSDSGLHFLISDLLHNLYPTEERMAHLERKIRLIVMLYISEQIINQEKLITNIIESVDTSLISEDN